MKGPLAGATTVGLLAAPRGAGALLAATTVRSGELLPAEKPVPLHKAQADFAQDGYPANGAIDGQPKTGWAVVPQTGKTHIACFETKEPISIPGGTVLTFTLEQRYSGKEHNLGRFRLSVTNAQGLIKLDGPPEVIAKVVFTDPTDRTPEQQAELERFFRSTDAELARLQRAVVDFGKPIDARQIGAQDLAWALMNTPAFTFNH